MKTAATQRLSIAILSGLLLTACNGEGGDPAAESSCSWNSHVQVHGALRAMFHEGQTGAMVTLDTVLPDADLYAVGALADLAGEITIVAGQAYLSYPEGTANTRTVTTSRTDAGAALLVAAEVPAWRGVSIEEPIVFEELDAAIGKLAAASGIDLDERFPFLVEGRLEDLQWHVIDGSRLVAGGTGHQDHLAASVQTRRERAAATLIGFHSERDQGVFTHMGSRTHLHCVLEGAPGSGHVDHVTVPAGATVKFPAGYSGAGSDRRRPAR